MGPHHVGPGAARVVDLESSGGFVYVVTEQCAAQAATCTGQLWRSADAADDFRTAATFTLSGEIGYSGPIVAVHDTSGYLVTTATVGTVTTSALLVTANGTTWAPEPNPCPTPLTPSSVAPVDTVRAAILCSGEGAAGSSTKALMATSDGGRTWVAEGSPPPHAGDGGVLSAATVSTLAIATSSAASWIYRSVDGGASWTNPLSLTDDGEGWGDFGFTDSTHGFAVHAPAGRYQTPTGAPSVDVGTMYVTSDAGATWSVVAF